jgi:hypothetical protein
MKAFKGFNKDLQCTPDGKVFQYEIGKTYEEDKAKLCNAGFHACEAPLDVFNHYEPANNRFCEVELDEVSDQRDGSDTKRVGKKITIGAEIGIPGLVKAHIEYVKARCTNEHTDPERATAGYHGAATAGSRGAATAGSRGAATAGDGGAATAGDGGAATAGSRGAATAGSRGAATAGEYGAATAKGKASVGKNGVALVRGDDVKAKGGIGSILVICNENTDNYDIAEWKAALVDGETIKADTWYQLVDGEFKEYTEEE